MRFVRRSLKVSDAVVDRGRVDIFDCSRTASLLGVRLKTEKMAASKKTKGKGSKKQEAVSRGYFETQHSEEVKQSTKNALEVSGSALSLLGTRDGSTRQSAEQPQRCGLEQVFTHRPRDARLANALKTQSKFSFYTY